ncbi:ABC transporter ATP-binding protein [Evansella sp. LMS18]|jgi:ABC-2 type transport system ATP-binding protein|uniref:ATP-binding cassette domain-containing protein n=1 Tax=Evansella sp. LMS18 TaxID=2924033 RepID=UPI0020D1B4DD|nr:ABC transporter ATP-binding protein [Evansella sp. LMS18]UTR10156.1 ABC transporter ATP-binding protein [Evansella sp. LMS18]
MRWEIEAKNIGLKLKDNEVLKDISFTLEHGKTYGLLGRNGAGKTSLLSLLASYREPTSGKLLIGGEEPFENRKVMPHVGFVYVTDYSDEDEAVKGYFDFAERYRPFFERAYAEELAERFKVPLDKAIAHLSSGKQSALNVILGLASRTPVTILDEVYLAMDAPTRDLFYKEVIEEQARHPRTMILSTHLVSEMEYLFDHVLLLQDGRMMVDEEYDVFVSRGASITGSSAVVDSFVASLPNEIKQLKTQQLGDTKSVMLYGELSEEKQMEVGSLGLDIGPVSLQELFIHLTGEEEKV